MLCPFHALSGGTVLPTLAFRVSASRFFPLGLFHFRLFLCVKEKFPMN